MVVPPAQHRISGKQVVALALADEAHRVRGVARCEEHLDIHSGSVDHFLIGEDRSIPAELRQHGAHRRPGHPVEGINSSRVVRMPVGNEHQLDIKGRQGLQMVFKIRPRINEHRRCSGRQFIQSRIEQQIRISPVQRHFRRVLGTQQADAWGDNGGRGKKSHSNECRNQ